MNRYERQLIIPGFGDAGQAKLKKARVAIAGAGGLGSVISIYLAVAGVGNIRIIDSDKVEITNLNRQILHTDRDIGRNKVDSAHEKLTALNHEVTIDPVCDAICEDNALDLLRDCDLIVDALDNLPTRLIINRVALKRNIPLFHGAVSGFEGRATTIIPGRTLCLRCLIRKIPPRSVTPVIGVTPAVIGSIQATEVIKYITGLGDLLLNRLVVYDGLSLKFMMIQLKKHPDCIECKDIVGEEK
jgi:molybdopterin/thiamine biosynthesis adenylyltransferase